MIEGLIEGLKVPAEKLRKAINPSDFGFEDTSTVEPIEGFIGHERAVQAIDMGLEIDSPDSNVFVAGSGGISRKSVLIEHIEEYARKKAAASGFKLRDFCYVCNFDKPDEPVLLTFSKGNGRKFRDSVEAVLREAQRGIPAIFRSDDGYLTKSERIRKDFQAEKQKLVDGLEAAMKAKELFLIKDHTGLGVVPFPGDHPMSQEEFNALPEETRGAWEESMANARNAIGMLVQKINELYKKSEQKIEALERGLVKNLLKKSFGSLKRAHFNYPEAISFLRGLQDFVLANINLFRESKGNAAVEPNGHNGYPMNDPFAPFRVNLFLDNSQTEKIPVIFESNPTFQNLFGKIEKKFVQGGYITDHTFLKAGSLVSADGGYLVLNVLDVLNSENPGIWRKLENTLKYGFLELEDPFNRFGIMPATLSPKPIPVRLKVILVGESAIYQLLVEQDNNFSANFKIKAELDSEMPATSESMMEYARFIAKCCRERNDRRENNLLPFSSSAVAKIAEHGHRLSDSQTKLSLRFDVIKDLITESNYFAAKAGSAKVEAEHVQMALASQRLRAGLVESKIQELMKDEILLITTQGREVGQVNGLVVLSTGDYSFGLPSRITATTFLGKKGVVSIDREVNMSGPIHNKGVHILSGYFGDQYGGENVISFSASICFEQSYHGVEGDSASFAELACIVSSLSRFTIDQSFAVTGSVNQKGEIQPIGGVNQKIEGFFDVCKARGLIGNKVIIPHQNVRNLMLREDIVDACREGKFYVYAIKTVDEGFELLLGEPAEAIHAKVEERLSEMTEKIKKASGRSED